MFSYLQTLFICDVWSNLMFAVYFFICMYWFIMYKMQSNAYILMPQRNVENSTYDIFFIFLVIILAAKNLAILMTIIDQTSADIFIMDWEKFEKFKRTGEVGNAPAPIANQAAG